MGVAQGYVLRRFSAASCHAAAVRASRMTMLVVAPPEVVGNGACVRCGWYRSRMRRDLSAMTESASSSIHSTDRPLPNSGHAAPGSSTAETSPGLTAKAYKSLVLCAACGPQFSQDDVVRTEDSIRAEYSQHKGV